MILQRITKRIKEQNWFAVTLELIVVIAGIVLGLQFTDWNESRKDRALEAYYLEQLHNDFEESLVLWDGYLVEMEEKESRARAVAQTLLDQSLSSETRAQFDENWTYLWGWLHLNFLTTTLDELRDTGRLTLIRSGELRQELVRFNTHLQVQQAYNSNLGNMLMSFYTELGHVTRMKPGSYELLSSNEELLEDGRVYNYVNQVAIYQSTILEQARISYREAADLKEKIIEEKQ